MKIKSLAAIISEIPIQPFAWLEDGRPVYPLRGADPDDDDDDSEDDDDDDADDDDSDDSDEDEDDDDAAGGNSSDSKTKAERVRELSRENKKRRLQAKKYKKELEEAQAKLQEIDDKDKTELDKAKSDLKKLQEQNSKLEKQNKNGAIERAFLKDNKHKWHSADAALKLVDLSEVEYDADTGEVTGMKDAIKQLAKDHPYLVDKGEVEDDDAGSAGSGKGGTPTGGSIGGGSNKKGGRNAERARLEKRFPVLNRG